MLKKIIAWMQIYWESRISNKTKAILPVHFTGYTPDMNKIMQISKKYNIPVIEDACQEFYQVLIINSGTWGVTGLSFSLHPLKNLNVSV